jgi:hypothetical protein
LGALKKAPFSNPNIPAIIFANHLQDPFALEKVPPHSPKTLPTKEKN